MCSTWSVRSRSAARFRTSRFPIPLPLRLKLVYARMEPLKECLHVALGVPALEPFKQQPFKLPFALFVPVQPNEVAHVFCGCPESALLCSLVDEIAQVLGLFTFSDAMRSCSHGWANIVNIRPPAFLQPPSGPEALPSMYDG